MPDPPDFSHVARRPSERLAVVEHVAANPTLRETDYGFAIAKMEIACYMYCHSVLGKEATQVFDRGTDPKAQLGQHLAAVREAQGVEQKDLAEAIGISASALCKIEKGQRGLDSLVLYRVAEKLNQPLSAFFPTPDSEEDLMLARQRADDDGALQQMADWSVKVLRDLDFVRREHARR